jgi:hypothetical protein
MIEKYLQNFKIAFKSPITFMVIGIFIFAFQISQSYVKDIRRERDELKKERDECRAEEKERLSRLKRIEEKALKIIENDSTTDKI